MIYEIENKQIEKNQWLEWQAKYQLSILAASGKPKKGTPAKIMITSNTDAVVTSLTKFDRVKNTPFIIG